MIKLKRAYEKHARADGERILVERLWPRGLTKLQAKIDLWLKDVAPSTELRRWFGHDPAKWENPNKLDITRRLDGNIVFGAGAHFCIGTYLVRVQGNLMLTEFMKRFPDAELVDGDGKIDYEWTHHNARRINRLMVKTNRKAGQRAA